MKRVRSFCVYLTFALATSSGAQTDHAPPMALGVNERIANHHDARASDVDSIWTATRWLGVCWVRENLVWPEVEPSAGTYRVQSLIHAFLRAKPSDRKILAVLGFANAVYTPSLPQSDDTRAAYRRYLEYIIARYAPEIDAWQVWNEPNIRGPRGTPPVSPAVIAEATRLTRAVLDSLDPTALLIGPAILGPDTLWSKVFQETGADTLADIIALHYYPPGFGGGGSWRGFPEWIHTVRTLWPGRPIWITETGASTSSVPSQVAVLDSILSDARQAGIDALFWWNLRDFSHGNARDYICGLYRLDWSPKPAAFVFRSEARNVPPDQECIRQSPATVSPEPHE